MILFVCALSAEARAVIDFYRLKKCEGPIDCYCGNEVALVVSGMGKMAASVATSHLLTRYPKTDLIINFGIAGSADKTIPIGTPLLVHKITDWERQKDYYPDILFRHPFRESSLTTCDAPQGGENTIKEGLVDMEASGFFEAARVFVPLHKIVVFKIVSDHLETSIPPKEEVVKWIAEVMERIDFCLKSAGEDFKIPGVLLESETRMLEKLFEQLRLTRSQQEQLQNLAVYHKLQHGTLTVLQRVEEIENGDKRTRNAAFENLKALLVQ